MDERHLPSAQERNVLYNISPDEASMNGADVNADTQFVVTQQPVPEIGVWEDEDIQDAIARVGQDWLLESEQRTLTVANETIFEPNAIGFVTFDRTAHLAVTEPASINFGLVTRLQDLLRSRFPLWRIRACLDEKDDDLIIYPDVVGVGGAQCTDDFTAGLKAWICRTTDRWEKWQGPQRRQFSRIKTCLPGAIARLGSQLSEVVCVCDNYIHPYECDYEAWTAWTISPYENRVVLYSDMPSGTSHGWSYPVFAEGSVGVRGDFTDETPFRLDEWCLKRRTEPFEFRVKVWPDGPSRTLAILPSDVVADAHLMELEGSDSLS